MGEKLKNPPLVEALCEFRFAEDSAWDWVLPGQLYEIIRADFPKRAQIQGFGMQVQALPKAKPVASVHPAPERVQFIRSDDSAMVQVGFNLLAINQLRPYSSWTEFSALIMQIYEEYCSIAGETSFNRIGLRYINHLVATENIADTLTVTPPLAGQLTRPLRSFFQRYDLQYDEPDGILVHQTGTLQNEENQPVFVLDIDFGSTSVQDLSTPELVRHWLDQAHDRVYEAFAASLSESLYLSLKG
ncbi:MAG: TIGR04255 family protein [Chloroflexi bacterium]|nr:TIGR04255 family protein [Chloroflexota bacterium]